MEASLCALYSIIFLVLIYKLKFFSADGITRSFLALAFLLKVAGGLALWWLYTYYYTDRSTADIYKYFDDSAVVHAALKNSPADYLHLLFGTGSDEHLKQYYLQMDHWYREFEGGMINEDRTMIRANAILRLFSFGHFNVHTVFFAFLSLAGLVALYKTFAPALKGKQRTFAVLLFLFPSLLFWGSGVLKESLALFAMGGMIRQFSLLTGGGHRLKAFVFFLLFAFLLVLTKAYVFIAFLPGLAIWLALKASGQNYALLKSAMVVLLFGALALLVPKADLAGRIVTKQRMFIHVAEGGTHLLHDNKFVYIEPAIKDPIIPTGTKGYARIRDGVPYTYWFRERPKDTLTAVSDSDTSSYWVFYSQPPSGSRIGIGKLDTTVQSLLAHSPAAFWNTLALLLASVIFSSRGKCDKRLFYPGLCFVVLLFILIGLTTPVMGAIVRYKVPALPFLFACALLLLDKEKLAAHLPFLKSLIA